MADPASETRAKTALIIAAILCAWGAVEAYGWENAYQRQNHDPYMVNGQEYRLEAIREMTPPDAVLGYVTDLKAGSVAADAAFNGARYTLAPRLLRRDARAGTFVLGLLSKPDNMQPVGSANGLIVVLPFNNGAVLYRRAGAR